jgi:hypothetical protein
VRLVGHPPDRIAPALEVTMYLVVAEAATATRERLDVTVAEEPAAGEEGFLELRVDGWNGPVDQLLGDRVATLGGTVVAHERGLVVRLPATAR